MRRLGHLARVARIGLLGGFVLMEPPLDGKGGPDAARPVAQWTRVSAHDSRAACDDARTARIADAEDDLGEPLDGEAGGGPLGAALRARQAARCVDDATLVPPKDAAR